LYTAFGKTDYKGKQKEIVEAGIQGADIFVSAPTGMGKVRAFYAAWSD
jgi:superfamily II DNA helicase RecQ